MKKSKAQKIVDILKHGYTWQCDNFTTFHLLLFEDSTGQVGLYFKIDGKEKSQVLKFPKLENEK